MPPPESTQKHAARGCRAAWVAASLQCLPWGVPRPSKGESLWRHCRARVRDAGAVHVRTTLEILASAAIVGRGLGQVRTGACRPGRSGNRYAFHGRGGADDGARRRKGRCRGTGMSIDKAELLHTGLGGTDKPGKLTQGCAAVLFASAHRQGDRPPASALGKRPRHGFGTGSHANRPAGWPGPVMPRCRSDRQSRIA